MWRSCACAWPLVASCPHTAWVPHMCGRLTLSLAVAAPAQLTIRAQLVALLLQPQEAAIGQAPPLTDEGVFEHLHKTAKHLDHEFREANKKALLNVVSGGLLGRRLFIRAVLLAQPQVVFCLALGACDAQRGVQVGSLCCGL